jgi:CheY-like chemotaxis protein
MKKLKILIAEDDELSSQLIAFILDQYENEMITVDTGKKAVEALHKNPDIDLVLMDIKMPELDGYEATRLIREFNTRVVIIAQTAYALFGDKEKALAAGCNNYITKPINKSELEELVKKYFEQSIQIQ